LLDIRDAGVDASLTPFQLVQGSDAIATKTDSAARPASDTAAIDGIVSEALSTMRVLVLAAFGPAALCALFGLIGVARRRFGRGLGLGAMLFGAIGLAVWWVIDAAIEEAGTGKGIAMWLLLGSSVGAALGGLLALLRPDRGEDGQARRYAATIRA
jgi:hypothetical protein